MSLRRRMETRPDIYAKYRQYRSLSKRGHEEVPKAGSQSYPLMVCASWIWSDDKLISMDSLEDLVNCPRCNTGRQMMTKYYVYRGCMREDVSVGYSCVQKCAWKRYCGKWTSGNETSGGIQLDWLDHNIFLLICEVYNDKVSKVKGRGLLSWKNRVSFLLAWPPPLCDITWIYAYPTQHADRNPQTGETGKMYTHKRNKY